ncbi:MAG: YeiH family protein [Steroidobacteraceae bacterium]
MVSASSDSPPSGSRWRTLLPGLALGGAVTAAAFLLRSLQLPGLTRISPLMLAILIGMLVRNTLGRPEAARAGLAASLRGPLRLGIILLGLQVTLAEILGIGWAGLLILAFALLSTYLLTLWLGGRLGVAPGLTTLIAAGTGVCGASAIVAANTVVRDGDESVAYALATVTLFGTLAMFSYPLVGAALELSPQVYGLWSGASVHEVAQVVAAGFARGQAEGEFATVAKLARVLMLAPLVIGMGLWAARQTADRGDTQSGGRAPIPWFVFGFLALVLLGDSGWIDPQWRSMANIATQVLLTFALAAVGLETDVRRLVAQGWQPLLLGALATAYIALSTLLLALLWGRA